jgi:hypothetical protein
VLGSSQMQPPSIAYSAFGPNRKFRSRLWLRDYSKEVWSKPSPKLDHSDMLGGWHKIKIRSSHLRSYCARLVGLPN